MEVVDETPILSRLDRLDNLMRHLEEIRGSNRSSKSSAPSTTSSGTPTSEGHVSSLDFSPRSRDKYCRPIADVIVETEHKGNLLDRVSRLEQRLLQLEEEMEAEKGREDRAQLQNTSTHHHHQSKKTKKKKGLKQFVKSFVNSTKKST